MQEKQKINIVWFKNDLRTKDQISLFKAYQEDLPFIALYIFDEDFYQKKQFGFRKIGKFRAKFLLESVQDLQHNLAELNIPFLIKLIAAKGERVPRILRCVSSVVILSHIQSLSL